MQAVSTSFRDELELLLNRYHMENGSDTPDFLLANYLIGCLQVWNTVVPQRDHWSGRSKDSEPVEDTR